MADHYVVKHSIQGTDGLLSTNIIEGIRTLK